MLCYIYCSVLFNSTLFCSGLLHLATLRVGFDKNHRFFMIFCRSGPEKRSIRSDFSATRYDLDKRRKTPSANVLNFMLASLQHLGASERRVLPVQRSDFAEKLCFLALGSQEWSNRSVNWGGGGVGGAEPPPPWLLLALQVLGNTLCWEIR